MVTPYNFIYNFFCPRPSAYTATGGPPWIIACIRPWNIFNLKSRAPYIDYVYAHDTNTHVHTHTHTFCSIDCLCVLYKDNTKVRQIEGDERDIQIKS